MGDTSKLTWTDYQGRERGFEVNHMIDVRKFLGTPGYSMLVVAANTEQTIANIEMFLEYQAREYPLVERSKSWIQRRRWLFQQPDARNEKGLRNRDGRDKIAVQIMGENPRESARGLVKILKERGITRSKDWCWKHRGDSR